MSWFAAGEAQVFRLAALLGHVSALATPETFNLRWILLCELVVLGCPKEGIDGRIRDMVKGDEGVFNEETSLTDSGLAGWTVLSKSSANLLTFELSPWPELADGCAVAFGGLAHLPKAIGNVHGVLGSRPDLCIDSFLGPWVFPILPVPVFFI